MYEKQFPIKRLMAAPLSFVNIEFDPPKVHDKDDHTGEDLHPRPDSKHEEYLAKRLSDWHET